MMKRVLVVASMLVVGPVASLACGGMSLPSLDPESLLRIGAASLPIGPDKEREIGFGIAATVAGRYSVVEDPELTRYINTVGQAVALQSVRRDEVAFRFGVLDADEVNAFAAPGGFIFVTRGALGFMESESDLAGVLAHEIAHVDQKHVLDEIRRSSLIQTATDEADLRGPLLDRISEFGSSLLFMGLSREDEMESDSLAVLYTTATGYQAAGLVRFLERLAAAELEAGDADPALREWLATHPSMADRIEALRGTIARAGIDPYAGQDVADRFRAHVR
jgi:beta-barrel assembly-enhancing protease